MNDIPKVVHATWKNKYVIDDQSPVILNGLRNVVEMNPDWKLEISDDHDLEEYLKDNMSWRDYELVKNRPMVEKTDLWRLIKMFNEGGMYIDIDRYYNIPLNQILEPGITMLLPTNQDFDFSQDFMLSAPGNEVYSRAIQYNLYLRKNGESRIYLLGAQGYMLCVTSYIMDGAMISSDPGTETFGKIRERLAQIKNIKTYRESPPNDTMVFNYDAATWKPGNGKHKLEFYAAHGVKHWAKP